MRKISKTIQLCSFIFIFGCNSTPNNKWLESEKKTMRSELDKTIGSALIDSKKQKWIDCLLEKCEEKYSSYAQASNDETGLEFLMNQCNSEVFSNNSILGQWSNEDRVKFRKDMEAVQDVSYLGRKKDLYIDCFLRKCEQRYNSYYEANNDERGNKALLQECVNEIN
jgi:hypothetical protein